jgi:hypothetical protein
MSQLSIERREAFSIGLLLCKPLKIAEEVTGNPIDCVSLCLGYMEGRKGDEEKNNLQNDANDYYYKLVGGC